MANKSHLKRKSISIEIEYSDIFDLKLILDSVRIKAKKGVHRDRFMRGGALCEMSMNYVSDIDCRHELINGEMCLVIKSKL
jgi:hypothetical protein